MPQQGGGGMLSGIMGGVVQGMAFGTGSQLAGRALDSVMGARQVEHVHTNAPAEAAAAPGKTRRSQRALRIAKPADKRRPATVCNLAALSVRAAAASRVRCRQRSDAACLLAKAAAAQMQVCGNETQMFQDCVKNSGGDVAPCQVSKRALPECRQQRHVHMQLACVLAEI